MREETPPAPARYGRVFRLSLPIILSNLSVPLMGAIDTAVMGHLPDPAYIGGVALGALVFTAFAAARGAILGVWYPRLLRTLEQR